MLFSSLFFIFFFLPIALGGYYLCSFHTLLKNIWLLAVSLFFYAWGEPKFVFVMLVSIACNYLYGLLVGRYTRRNNPAATKWVVVLMCTTNLGLLFVFKYLDFTIGSIYTIFGIDALAPSIALPIGISFFTFQAMSYGFDVYRDEVTVQKNPFYLALYIAFFPQLVAGPIVRYASVEDQLTHRKESMNKVGLGLCRFVTGLAKKVLIANNMALITDTIYGLNAAAMVPASLAWLGAFAYALQIFFDFSAYSDMAIGLGLMFGFKFDENFNYPYIARSATDFWRRWHISLSRWFKTYLYIPLGGSRVANKDIMMRNLLVVWLCTGIWHGATWVFVLWGVWNFCFVLAERITDFEHLNIPTWVRHVYTVFFFTFGFVLFRAESFGVARGYIGALFGGGGAFWSAYTGMFLREHMVFFVIAILLCFPVARRANHFIVARRGGATLFHIAYPFWIVLLFTVSVSYLVVGSYNPFIYFNF